MSKKKTTVSGIEIPERLNEKAEAGKFPFTRGIYSTMYRKKKWTIRQYSGFSTATETNKRFRLLLKRGQTGLSIAFDLPTQMGLDSDDPLAIGEVGKVGVAIDTVEDMKELFHKIDVSKISTSMTINATAMILLAMYAVVAEETGVDPKKISGTVQNDILKEYIARGTYIFPPEPSLKLITDIFEYANNHFPKFNTISISGYHIREAGSTAIQEIAFTLANAKEYVRRAINTGLNVDEFAPRLSFFFNAHNDFLEEVAKYRAARQMWAKIMKDEFGAKRQKSQAMRFHTQTAGSSLTAQQPENNIVRTTLQATAAVLGGTQSLHTNSMDEALALPTDKAATIALRTQQIIAEESGIPNAIDPFGGSYFMEWLTDKLEVEANKLIAKIEEVGVVEAIRLGIIQREIEEAAFQYQMEVDEKSRIIVGVNEFVLDEKQSHKLLKVDEEIREVQTAKLKKIKKQRDKKKVETALKNLKDAISANKNLFLFVMQAVKERATIGEICDVLREQWGKYTPSITIS